MLSFLARTFGVDDVVLTEEKDEFGASALHREILAGNTRSVRAMFENSKNALLARNLLVHVTNDGFSCLHLAVVSPQSEEMLRMIFEFARAQSVQIEEHLSLCDLRGLSPIHIAANNGNAVLCKMMCERAKKSDVQIKTKEGQNASHLAAAPGRLDCLKELVSFDVFDDTDQDGRTPLHCAAWRGNADCVAFLLKHIKPETINAVSKNGSTALMLACKSKSVSCVRLLLHENANVSIAGGFGATALHVACAEGSVECVRLLLEANANVFDKDDDGLCAPHYAVSGKNEDVIRALRQHCVCRTEACDSKCALATMNAQDYSGATPLIKAAFSHRSMIPVLLECGADPTIAFDHQWNALHVIANGEDVDYKEALLQLMLKNAPNGYSFDRSKARVVDNSKFHRLRGAWNRIPIEIRNDVFRGMQSLEGVAARIREGRSKKIVVLAGAGISTALNIPDFRSDTGIYKSNKSNARLTFDGAAFLENPETMYNGCREMFLPTLSKPISSITHRFFGMLEKKGLLTRVYDQNVDGITAAFLSSPDMVRECHGTIRTSRCSKCKTPAGNAFWNGVQTNTVSCCARCGFPIRPDVVLFGEPLPSTFTETQFIDLSQCDMLFVMGTSLQVYPFASLLSQVPDLCPRVLFNREAVGPFVHSTFRDVPVLGEIEQQVSLLVQLLGWEKEMDELVPKEKMIEF